MTEYNLIDSSVWIDYLINGNNKELVETEEKLLLATISIIEIRKKLHKLNIPKLKIKESINYIKKLSILISLDEDIAEKASEIVTEKKMTIVDSIVYASSVLNNALLLTMDNDFRGLNNVRIL